MGSDREMKDVVAFHPRPPAGDAIAAGAAVAVSCVDRQALLEDLDRRLAHRRGFCVATLNLDHIVKLRRGARFRAAYARHTHVVADGNPIVWLHRLAGRRIGLVPGSELVEPLCAIAARQGVPVALFGGRPETLAKAAAELVAAHPDLQIVARIAPSMAFDAEGPEADICLDALDSSGARLCLLALGAPKQEIFAVRGLERRPDCGFVSVGAGLDFLAQHQIRAPLWMRRIAMEWAWRMMANPRRLARRYLNCALILPALGLAALRARWQHGATP